MRFKLALFLVVLLAIPLSPVLAGEIVCGCPHAPDAPRVITPTNPPVSGDDVIQLQEMLSSLGLYKGPRDGVYGAGTEKAIRSFQKSKGLKPDGVVDEKTWQALGDTFNLPAYSKVKPPPGNVSILINTINRTLTILSDGEPFRQYRVAVGKYETPTPIGNWKVTGKAKDKEKQLGTRWIGLNVPWGTYGIHGTNAPHSIGGFRSHGCIRMHNSQVEEIFPWVPAGTPVIIVGRPFLYMDQPYKTIKWGDVGSPVMEVQRKLKRLGYYHGKIDGIWGRSLEEAVEIYRMVNELPGENRLDPEMYRSLGL